MPQLRRLGWLVQCNHAHWLDQCAQLHLCNRSERCNRLNQLNWFNWFRKGGGWGG